MAVSTHKRIMVRREYGDVFHEDLGEVEELRRGR